LIQGKRAGTSRNIGAYARSQVSSEKGLTPNSLAG
jgi:hypothetical protein